MHHRSSTSALIAVLHDWLRALDEGHEICVVFFDVQKAFDLVPHIPLLQKLANINIDPYILKWVQNYLTDRRQYVVVEGLSSPTLNFLSGVPSRFCPWPTSFISMMLLTASLTVVKWTYLQMTSHCTGSSTVTRYYKLTSMLLVPASMKSISH